MPISPARVLLVDDEPNILKTMTICLKELGLNISSFSKPLEAEAAVQTGSFDLAFIDLKMSPINGLELLEKVKISSPQTDVVIITAQGSIDSAVEAMKLGASDFLQKPFDGTELQLLTKKLLEVHSLKKEVLDLREQLREQFKSRTIITRNQKMEEMINLAGRIADSQLSVLIEGESGTGKELFADLLHNESSRKDKPFVKINCAAVPENLLESELFGHVKGSFTGALKDRTGRFEEADGGTVFLDEIAEISTNLQAKLLRVLQSSEIQRVGENKIRKVDVRVISATNMNMEEALKEGTFREDLFYRINAVRLGLPPLRERPEDIPLLAEFFLKKFDTELDYELEEQALKALAAYRWYGNVRELENVIHRAVVLAQSKSITLTDLPEEIQQADEGPQQLLSLEEIEKSHIKKVLQSAADYNEAARILAVDPATLWRKRKRYDL